MGLLTYSLEKRLVPRHCVMKVLWEKGLLNSNSNFFTVIKLSEETCRFLCYNSCWYCAL
jgi:mTERF domain-containing protein, mitochondrial